MTKKTLATLLGILASAAGVVLWIILGMLGVVAGLAGAVMGILFCVVYSAINHEDKSNYPYIVAALVMLVEIVFSEIFLWMMLGVSVNELFTVSDYTVAFFMDLGMGVLFSAFCLGYYVSYKKRKQKTQEYIKQQQQRAAAFSQNDPFNATATVAVSTDKEAQDATQSEPKEIKMRKVNVTRKKKFVGCAVPYSLHCNGQEIAILKNGKTHSFEISTAPHSIQVICIPKDPFSGGPILSNEIITDTNEDELNFEVVMEMGFTHNTLRLTKM